MSDENFSEDFIRDVEEKEPETVTLNFEDETPVAEEESFSLDDVKDEMTEQQEEKKKEVKEEIEESIPDVEDIIVPDTEPEEEHEVIVDDVVISTPIENTPTENTSVEDEEEKPKPKNSKLILIIIGVVLFIAIVAGGLIIYTTNEPPKIYTVHIESDNFDDHTIAKYGNKITLTFSFTENLRKPPRVVINNREVEVFGEHKEYYAKYFVSNQGMEDVVVTFTIEDYEDRLFKKGSPVISTTDNSQVTIKSIIS